MGEAFIVRRGGGTSLNFRVIGSTAQPTSAKENDIWVNTSVPISEWRFQTHQPVDPADGVVWIESALSSSVQFNTLKKNALLVYPKSVKQYVDGEWESMNAYVYQGNAWVQFSSDFPEYWFHYAGHGWNQEMGAYKQWGSVGTVGTDEISIPVQTTSYGQDGIKVGIYQETAFDFTNFQKLKFEYKGDIYSSGSEGVFIGIGNTSGDWPASNWDAQMVFRQAVADWTAYEIDISAVNKSSRLRLMVWATKGSSAHIRNITLE